MGSSGFKSKGSHNTERGLHPSLLVQTQPNQVTNGHKQICQPTKTVPPFGGTVSADKQKCSRTVRKPKLKPNNRWRPILDLSTLNTFLNTESFKMETPETIRTSLQVGEWVTSIDFKDAYFHIPIHSQSRKYMRFHIQGQSYQFKALPFGLSTAPMEFTVVAKEVKLMEGYKNPPVPRRLVGESHIPSNLSPACTDLGSSLSRTRAAGEPGKVRTGSKTGLQLHRLPVRPQGGTHTRALADLNRQDTVNPIRSSVPGQAVHVPYRPSNSHRKTSPPGATSYEAHTVALEKQLEGTRVTGKGDTRSQVAPPSPKMVARGKQCSSRSTITPSKTCSANLYRRIKRRVGRSLKRAQRKGNLVSSRKQVAHKSPGRKAVFLALKEFQDLCSNNTVLVATDNTTVVAYINKEGGMKSGSLCALLWRILSWCTRKQVTLKAHHIPSRLNVIADKLSRLGQTIQTEWSLHPEVLKAICSRWHQPQVDLFATRFNNKLPQFVSPVPDPQAWAVDALSLSWENLDPYAFPPAAILGKVVEKLQDYPCNRIIPGWPNMPWFCDLVAMSSQIPLCLPNLPNLVSQPFNQTLHRNLSNLNLHAWLLEPQQSRSRASLRQWQYELRLLREDQPDLSMRQSGPFLQSGASVIRWTSGHHL